MSLRDAFIAFEQNHNTNPLIASARAAGVTAADRDIIKAAEAAAAPVDDGNGGHQPVRLAPALLEKRADQFVAAVSA